MIACIYILYSCPGASFYIVGDHTKHIIYLVSNGYGSYTKQINTWMDMVGKGLVTYYRQSGRGGDGGLQNWKGRGGGQVKFYPYKMGGRKSFSHAEGRHNKF